MRFIAAVAAVAALGSLPSVAQPAASGKARLFMADRSPLAVRGVRFKARELVRVRVIVRGGPRLAKSVRTDRLGVLRARFVSLSLDQCAFFTVQATGYRGSRASYTQHPPPCGPAP